MTEPRTAAGRALLERVGSYWYEMGVAGDREGWYAAIAAIEAEVAELAGGLDLPRCVVDHAHDADEGHCVYETDDEYAARLSRQSVVIPAGQDETPRTGEHSS